MEQLTDLELILLNGLVEKYPTLKSHISFLKVKERKSTKVGMIIDFDYTNEKIIFEEINALFSGEENIEIKGLKEGLSYVIDVTDGQILYIEFTTYGENWNGKFGDYKIVKE